MLTKKRNSLKPENFKDFDDYLLKKIPLNKRINYLLEKEIDDVEDDTFFYFVCTKENSYV